ncbi:MAG: membrane protein insertion efficiency factor YidD [Gemmatimonadetes bacterium]|nr:membrane protein insertion efficiency factor YidD [Gemmatimonadota bacterium]
MLRRSLLALIRFYQVAVSPWTPAACRFTPTCSAYAAEAIDRHGAARGSWLAVRRLIRCHPWGGKGYDPVPPARAGEPLTAAGETTVQGGPEGGRNG